MALLSRPVFVLFGDSITQYSFKNGWGAAIANEYCRHADVKLRGYSGYNTRWCKKLLPHIFPPKVQVTPTLVTVMLGANDANLPPPLKNCPAWRSRQHVPVDEYRNNLKDIVDAIKSCGDGTAKILLMTPPPIDQDKWGKHCIGEYNLDPAAQPDRHFDNTKRYAQVCLEVAKELGVPGVDMNSAIAAHPQWKDFFYDGLHPNDEGNDAIYEVVSAAIKSNYPELSSNALPFDFPCNREIDETNLDFPDIIPGPTCKFST